MDAARADAPGSVVMAPVGFVSSGFDRHDEVPHRHDGEGWTAETSTIGLLPQHARKLGGLDGYSHVIIIFWVHRAREWRIPKDHARTSSVVEPTRK